MTILSTLIKPATTLAEREAKKTLHGALMIWGWGVFIPSGLLMASYARETFAANGIWFKVHRALGYAGVAMASLGYIVGNQVGSGRQKTHQLVGYLVTLIGLLQPVIAYYRPNPKEHPEQRKQWFMLHKYLGWLCLVLGLYNIRLGLQMWDPENALSTAYATGVAAAGSVVVPWNVANLM